MNLAEIVQRIDSLKAEIDALRPIDREQELRVRQKFWLDWNYHSNAIEGNTLTYGETRAFLLHGITAAGKPFRDYLDMKGHKEALEYLEELVRNQAPLTEVALRELHKILLIEPYEMPAITPEGWHTTRKIAVGRYKTAPNSVLTSTGQLHLYTTPEDTPGDMGNLMKWYRGEIENKIIHPLILAATFHHRFVAIHPFDDGNGRMARLLMNLILMQVGFVPIIIHTNTKQEYILALEQADEGDIGNFVEYIGQKLIQSLELYLRAAKGERIDELIDLDKQIALLQKRLVSEGKTSYSEKTVESHEALWKNLLEPFLNRLFARLAKFDIYFGKHAVQFWYEVSGPKVLFFGDNAILVIKKLGDLLSSDPSIYRVTLSYKWNSFLNSVDTQLNVELRMELAEDQISIDYVVSKSVDAAIVEKRENLLTEGYFREYKSDEIDHLVYPIVNEILQLVEKMTESS